MRRKDFARPSLCRWPFCSKLADCFAGRALTHNSFKFRALGFAILTAICTLSVAQVAEADPWLDRVEQNLRRINSATQYSEPVSAGSPAAKEKHGLCLHHNDELACDSLIWRRKELLPISDWAVGSAHKKRGELREKRGDILGAIDDYNDAQGYHNFPFLKARVKRLKLRHEEIVASAKTAEPPELDNASAKQSATSDQPIIVSAGWGVDVLDDAVEDRDERVGVGQKNVVPAQHTGLPSLDGKDITVKPDAKVGADGAQKDDAGLKVAEDRAGSQPFAPAVDKAAETEPNLKTDTKLILAARYVPGVPAVTAAGDQPTSVPSQVATPSPQIRQNVEPSLPVIRNDQEMHRSLQRVRDATATMIETSALPHQSRVITSNSSFPMLALAVVFTTLTLMVLLAPAHWFRFWPRAVQPSPNKSVLSVDDLEALIERRSHQSRPGGAPPNPPVKRAIVAAPPIPTLPKRETNRSTIPEPVETKQKSAGAPVLPVGDIPSTPARLEAFNEPTPGPQFESAERQSQILTREQTPTADPAQGDKQEPEKSSTQPPVESGGNSISHPVFILDEAVRGELLQSAAQGRAGLVYFGSQSDWDKLLSSHLDHPQEQSLRQQVWRWDENEESVSGVLNIFSTLTLEDTQNSLRNKQRFNAAFEFYLTVFEAIFGPEFIQHERVTLRHLVLLMQRLPQPSLLTLSDLLARRSNLDQLRDAIDLVDNVHARLFYTSILARADFADRADRMLASLHRVLHDPLLRLLLTGNEDDRAGFAPASIRGAIYIPMDQTRMSSMCQSVLARSLCAAIGLSDMYNGSNSGGPAHRHVLVIPNIRRVLGGSELDAEFLIEQLSRSNWTVL